jgi:amino acid transporter
MNPAVKEATPAQGQLGLWSTISIIVGIVIGTTIYKVPWLIFSNTANPGWGLLVWAIGGLIALIGAFCYAELASTYPKAGGDYYYLSRGFSSSTGFLFGWAQLVVVMPASIGAMAVVFADFAQQAFVPKDTEVVFEIPFVEGMTPIGPNFAIAAYAIGLLTITNVLGVVVGKVVQNLLTALKVVGLGGIIFAGFYYAAPNAWEYTPPPPRVSEEKLATIVSDPEARASISQDLAVPVFGSLAMILVMYAFGGWNDSAFVAAEVRNPRRNIPAALFLGITIIVVVYLLVNAAYINGLGWDNVRKWDPDSVPVRLMKRTDLEWSGTAMAVLVMISALGAVNGLIFTGARVYATLGSEHRLFGWMGHWRPGKRAPIVALVLQGLLALFLVGCVTTNRGHRLVLNTLDGINKGLAEANQAVESVFEGREIGQIKFDRTWAPGSGFEKLVDRTAPVFWFFFLLTGLSLFRLRNKNPHVERPYSVPWYPLTPILFSLSCAWMLYRAVIYVEWHCLLAVALVIVGLPLYWFSCLLGRPAPSESLDIGLPRGSMGGHQAETRVR